MSDPLTAGDGPPNAEDVREVMAAFERWRSPRQLLDVTAEALEFARREEIKRWYDLGYLSDTRDCISRLTGVVKQCRHDLDAPPAELVEATPPHQPIPAEHCDLWYRGGTPTAFSLHVAELGRDRLTSLLAFCHEHELEFTIAPVAFRPPYHLVHVLLWAPDSARPRRLPGE